jgi:hypothetical protein
VPAEDILPGIDELAEGTYGGPDQPLRYSTHTYTIELEDASNYSVASTIWSIHTTDAPSETLTAGTEYTITASQDGTNPRLATARIRFNQPMAEGTYILRFTEATANGCSTSRDYPFTLNAPFDVNITQVDDQCPDESGSIHESTVDTYTVITYPVVLESSNYAANWSLSFEISISSSPAGQPTEVDGITIQDSKSNTTLNYTSGLTGSVSVNYSSSDPTTTFNLVVRYKDVHATEQTITMLLEDIAGQFGERDIHVILDQEDGVTTNVEANNTTTHLIQSLPAPGDLLGVD